MLYVPRRVKHGYPMPWVEGLLGDDTVVLMHYAYGDGDGLMPPFEGWFRRNGTYYSEVKPVAWRYECRK